MSEVTLQRIAGGAIVEMKIDRGGSLNALTLSMYERMSEMVEGLANDKDVRVLLLRGAPSAFAAGTDIREFRVMAAAEDFRGYERVIGRTTRALLDAPVPSIAALTGFCTGGGAALACACDLRIGTPAVRFGLPVARTLGNAVSSAALAQVAAVTGFQIARRLLMTAALIDGEEAFRLGVLDQMVPEQELYDTARDLAHQVSRLAPKTLRASKAQFRRLTAAAFPVDPEPDPEVLDCYLSHDFQEGVAAFLEKRAPQWKDE